MKLLLIELFSTPRIIGAVVRFASSVFAALIIRLVTTGPGWLQDAIVWLSTKYEFEINEPSLTGYIALGIMVILEYAAAERNGRKVKEIQEVVGARPDKWAYTETVLAVKSMSNRLDNAISLNKDLNTELRKKERRN